MPFTISSPLKDDWRSTGVFLESEETRIRISEMNVISLSKAIKDKIIAAFKISDEVMRGKAVETIEYEVEELDNIFAILVLGAFIGIPSPPIHITMELLPVMDQEFKIMLQKVTTAHDPLGDLFSVLDID
jgi:hypothetical protein